MIFGPRWFAGLLLCSVAFGVRAAHAEPTPAEISTARQAFESAVALEADQKWLEASKRLREALAIKDTPGLRFHLAHCEEQQGLLVEAALDYDRASELLQHGAKASDVQKLLVPASAELKRRIPHVVVEIPGDVRNPITELDGKAYAPSELALGGALNPGPHQLKVSAPGRRPVSSAFSLKEGEQITLRVDLQSSQPAVVSAAPRASVAPPAGTPHVDSLDLGGSGRRPSPKIYLLIGESAITAAGLALGIGYAVAGSSARDRVQTAQSRIDQAQVGDVGPCVAPSSSLSGPCSDLHRAIDDHDRDATLSAVGFVGAGVGAAALLTTWLAYPSRSDQSLGPSVRPVVAFGRIGLQGRF
jgi:hypothetical protein